MKHIKNKPSKEIDFDRPTYAPFLDEERFATLTRVEEQKLIAQAQIEIKSLEDKLGKPLSELINEGMPSVSPNGRSSENDYPALKEILERNLRLIVKFAPKIGHNYGIDRLESISEAPFAVYRAVRDYDPKKINPKTNTPFSLSTYVVSWIRGVLCNFSRKNHGVNGGELCRLKNMAIRRVVEDIFKSKGENPNIEEIADQLNKKAKPRYTVEQLNKYNPKDYSQAPRVLFLRMLEKPDSLPLSPKGILEDFAQANQTKTTDLIRLLRFPSSDHIESSSRKLREQLVANFGNALKEALKTKPHDWINPYLQKYTPHEVNLLIAQSHKLHVRELSTPLSDGFTLEDTVGDGRKTSQQEEINEIIGLSKLSQGELAVINARYFEERGQEEIGDDTDFIKENGVSKKDRLSYQRIQQIESEAIKKLRKTARKTES